jgi:hypothetical protein
MPSKNQTKLSVQLQFPATIPIYINAFEIVPLEPNLIQMDMGFLDIYNLSQDPEGTAQPQSVSRVVITSERAIGLIEELQKALELQKNVLDSEDM